MTALFQYFHQFNLPSVLLRLTLALLFGGIIGMERGRKRRAAGFRTYMLVCLGATVTMLLGQYNEVMRTTLWAENAVVTAAADVSRLGAQVISGIGFLGAGTILVTSRQEVLGLTTAAGLWASACMGLAIGSGFYACVVMVFALIFLCIRVFPAMERTIVEQAKSIDLHMEFDSLEGFAPVLGRIKQLGVRIYEIDIDRGDADRAIRPGATLSLRRPAGLPRQKLIAELSKLDHVAVIREL